MELTESAKNSKSFFNDVDSHFERMENEDFKENNKKLTITNGRKIWLEVDVKDEMMTYALFKWLYGKNEQGNDNTPFGCKLQAIHFAVPSSADTKKKLQDLLDSL